MANSKQIVKVTKSLTTAAECRNETQILMQPYANWEEYLTPAPLSIAILAELIFISSEKDFPIRDGGPEGGFKYIKYPDSFRACLMQVCNSAWHAFNDAHKNMDQIRLHTSNVPNYIKLAVQIIIQADDDLVQDMLPHQLENIKHIANECVLLAKSTDKRFHDVIKLIHELLETSTSAKQKYGEDLEKIRMKIKESELREKAALEANRRAEEALKDLKQQLKEAQGQFNSSMDSMPDGWEIIGMNFVEGLTDSVTSLLSVFTSSGTAQQDMPITGSTETNEKLEVTNPSASNNIYAKASQILSLVELLNVHFDGGQIKWSEIIDEIKKEPKTNWVRDQFVRIQKATEKENQCRPKKEALELCSKAINICSELENLVPEANRNETKTQEIVELVKNLRKEAMSFDSKSKDATNTSAFTVKPPQLSKTQEKSEDSKSAGQLATDNARFRIEQSRAQLDKVRELYDKSNDNMEKNKKEITEIYITLKNCKLNEIDFTTTIKVLAEGLSAMGKLKEQWQKLIRFFQMVSNLMETCVGTSLKQFVKTADVASDKTLKYSSKMFLRDTMYNQAFQASNISNLVNMIAGTYTEISNRYLMDPVSKLSTLMCLDFKQKEQIQLERKSMQDYCTKAEVQIKNLVLKNKVNFERKTTERLQKIESGLKAVLPPVSEEKEKELKKTVESAFGKDQDVELYI